MSYLSHYHCTIEKFEAILTTYLQSGDGTKANDLIMESMSYSLMAGGKRIRPMLLLEFCYAYSGAFENALPYAAAIEMIHTYSLIHDDLPCMDDDDLRRGKPTNHIVFGEDMAVLAGDGLLNLSSEIMLRSAIAHGGALNYLKAMAAIVDASGIGGMILGQVADIKLQDEDMTVEKLDYINKHKTGKLLTASMCAGAILGGASEAEVDHIETLGHQIGLLFQIVDDLLDITGDEIKMGKHTKVDFRNDKTTYPSLLGVDEAKCRVQQLANQIQDNLSKLSIDTTFVSETVNFLANRDY